LLKCHHARRISENRCGVKYYYIALVRSHHLSRQQGQRLYGELHRLLKQNNTANSVEVNLPALCPCPRR
jgi:hypothetical protein